jgi:hypothetical protein
MKRLVISLSVLLFASFALMTVFAQSPVNPARLMPGPNQPTVGADVGPNKTATAAEAKSKTETVAGILADPNKIQAAIQAFEGLQEDLDKLNKDSDAEVRQWLQRETGNKIPLAKDVHEQIMAELMFVRRLAVEEKAEKTTAAIDGLLLNRQRRFDELNEKFLEERREERMRDSRRERGSRSRYPPEQRSSERRPRGR